MILNEGIDCKNRYYNKCDIGRAKDITNYQFGRLKALFRVAIKKNIDEKYESNPVCWLCQCVCGNIVCVTSNKLQQQHTSSCGCLQKEIASQARINERPDLTGQVYNGITFLRFNNTYKKEHHITVKNAYWDCRCICGKEFTANSGEIFQNRILSCGCLGTRKSAGEKMIERILKENHINYIYDLAYFKDLIMLGGGTGRYDFIILDNNDQPIRLIEFDGRQHYTKNTQYTYEEGSLETIKTNDEIKNEYAIQHNLPLVRIPYNYLNKLSLELLMGDQFLINSHL